MKTFDNYDELKEFDSKLSDELIKAYGKGDWQNEQLFYYETIEGFAQYELTEGWYAALGVEKDWNGAPSPLDHVDLTSLGEALVDSWDTSSYHLTIGNEVIGTPNGW